MPIDEALRRGPTSPAPCNRHNAPLCFTRGASTQEMTMGLLDVLNGMQNGPRGPSTPSAQSGGGMSPMTMAILALLAYKAVKHLGGGQPGATPTPAPSSGHSVPGGGMGGGLGDLIKGGLGGLLAGGAAGSVISGGLGDLLRQFPPNGPGEGAHSWGGPGADKQNLPNDPSRALGGDQIRDN